MQQQQFKPKKGKKMLIFYINGRNKSIAVGETLQKKKTPTKKSKSSVINKSLNSLKLAIQIAVSNTIGQ